MVGGLEVRRTNAEADLLFILEERFYPDNSAERRDWTKLVAVRSKVS